jgi:DNA polymerase III delta subunit
MFYLIYGTDSLKARHMAQRTVAAARKKHAEAEFFKLTVENFSVNILDELIASQGLFYSGSVVLADNLCTEKEISEVVIKKLKEIKESPNFFVFLEGELNKKELEAFKKQADKVEECVKPYKRLTEKEELALRGEKISFFKFTDTLGERNKKALWTLFQDALAEEVPAEEVHGILFWQVRAMLSALLSQSPGEVGMKDYPYSKAKQFAKNYGRTAGEAEKRLKQMSADLFKMYHEAHRGKTDLYIALEKFILEL